LPRLGFISQSGKINIFQRFKYCQHGSNGI